MDPSSVDAEVKVAEPEKPFPNNYEELVGEYQVVEGGPKWSTERLLAEYVTCTDGLIGKLDGSIPLVQRDVYVQDDAGIKKEKRDLPPPASVIYLDKSARPVAHLVRVLWPILSSAPATQNDFFLNIDKGDWLRRMGVPPQHLENPSEEFIDFSAIPREELARIRALYSTVKIDEGNLDEAWRHPTIFDGKHIMVVDEVKSSGKTLSIAQRLLCMAIPQATFSGEYWTVPKKIALNGGAPVNGEMQYKREWMPVWYSPDNVSGRGVGDRDPRWPEASAKRGRDLPNWAKLGRNVLSTPPHDPSTLQRTKDTHAANLNRDIRRMPQDLTTHKILYCPSADRPSADEQDFKNIVNRIEAINGIDYNQWRTQRDALMANPRQ